MCTNESAVEENTNGYKAVDSVLLRITKHQNNCICHVSLQNTVHNYTISMSKYEGLTTSAPVQSNCGLAVDVESIDKSNTTQSIESINCITGTSMRLIALDDNELKFKSRIIKGNFTRGYCMHISRDQAILSCKMKDQAEKAGSDKDWIQTNGSTQHTSVDECKKYCLQTKVCEAVHFVANFCFVYIRTSLELIHVDGSVYSKKDCVDTQKLKIKCDLPEPTTQSSQETTTDVTISTKTDTVTTPISDSIMTSFNTQSSITTKDDIIEDKTSDLYVYIGAGAGGVLMILLIICIIVCIRKNSNQTSEKESKNYATKQLCKEDRDSDNDYDGLKDNILYVSSEPNEILEDGNYNTVDLEQTRKVNQDINLDGNYSTVDGICSNSSLSKSKPDIKPKQKTNSSLKEDQTKR
ncbi:unnamed protein product [Mytilus edulis]|uniref:Apple domain-containing protein n=1 Tax=Mytilus edulis TaxID=6550 RepID=A0A8S3U616_MYTED|nr:unnamed protein product [Mytilus edulis]